MSLSLNEIETTILKAARGAGMPWGLAEEAAQAARWLAGRVIGFETACLSALQAGAWRTDIVCDGERLRPGDAAAWMCPIRVGACLSDLAIVPPLRIERVLQPLLLLPFAARLERTITLAWAGGTHRLCGGQLLGWPGAVRAAGGDRAELVEVAASDSAFPAGGAAGPRGDGIAIAPLIWSQLHALEARTYVPASPRSRLSGAGAGTNDNE